VVQGGVVTGPLHPDFADLTIDPGAAQITGDPALFGLVNVIAFGGAADRHPHVPAELGRLGGVAIWESTGADDALPFWNTNLAGDVYLYLVHGEVRVEFKEVEREQRLGSYVGHTGDLMRLPKDVAHRTYSTNGRRRISLELVPYDPRWASLDWVASVPASEDLEAGGLRIEPGAESTTIRLDGREMSTSSSFLLRGARALLAYGLHLGHNEFDGGLVVSDGQDDAVLKVADRELRLPYEQAVALLKGVILRLEMLTGER
jgi:hypothetical protein